MMSRRRLSLVCACLLLGACFDDPPRGDGDGTATGTGDGDGDPGDGDGDPDDGDGDPGDGDGDPGDGDPGDGDGDPCEGVDCPCEGPSDCLPEHMCIDGFCADAWCGDAENNNEEPCDDGNAVDGDGCDNDCTYTDILSIGAGGAHNCALIEGGRVRCWGLNTLGQLGLGNNESIGDDELPSQAADVPLPGPAVQISVGDQHTCAVLADNNVRCWGPGTDGRLGYANTDAIGDDEFPTEPVDVGGMVEQVEAGAFHTCARLDNNNVRCWGLGSLGRLGYANTTAIGDNESPALAGDVNVGGASVGISVGGAHTCAIALVGSIRCWGRGEQGQLGYANTNNIGDNETPASAGNVAVIPIGLALNTKVEQLSHGVTHTCALFETGDVLCWGSALFGEIGTGGTNFLGDNELPASAPPIDLPGPAIAVTAGGAHSCALLENGDIHCWGANTFGELGYGNTSAVGEDESPSAAGPVQIGAPAIQIEAGFFHTCAVTNTNEVRCWGNNDGGQLGLGNTDRIGDDEIPNSVPTIELFPS